MYCDIYCLVSIMKGHIVSALAKLFMSGRSQAVRLPKEFRFKGCEVRVTKVGDRVILEPVAASGDMPWALIDQTGDALFMADGREQPAMPHDKLVFEP
jgi:antitoxin VapB